MEKEPKIKRSLSLSQKMNSDLLALSEALGVNPHSYMINELAKSIQRDSLSLQVKKNTQEQLATLLQFIQGSED